MLDKNVINAFMEELMVCSKPYRKGPYAPGCRLIDDMSDLSIKLNIDDNDIPEIVPYLSEYGLQLITIEDEHYLPFGTPVEEIKHKYLQIIGENGLDADMLYLLGTEEVARKHPEMFESMVAIAFFADKELPIGLASTQKAHQLLKEVLQEKHFTLHPEDIERSKGWVDEDTIAFLQPHVKAGYIPSLRITEAIQDLMIDYGDFPLSQNIVSETLRSMNVTSIVTTVFGSLKPTSDEAELQQRMTELLIYLKLDLEACYQNGIESIDQDILTLFRNQYFFVDERVHTFHDTDGYAANMISKILKDEHNRVHYDEADTQDSIDLEMLNELKVYEKNGYVPTWIVLEHQTRLLHKYGNFADAEKVRIDTLAALPAKVLLLNKDEYMQPGSRWSDVRAALIERINQWDLEQAFAQGQVPDLNHQEYTRLVAMIYFALYEIDDLSEANSIFLDLFTEIMVHDRQRRCPDELPMSVRREVEDTVRCYSKRDAVPSFIQDRCLPLLSNYLQPEWYATQVFRDILHAADVCALDMHVEDYLEPGTSKGDIEAKVRQIVLDSNLDFEYYLHQDCYSDEDVDTKYRAIYLVYFADNDIESREEAEDLVNGIIFGMSRDYLKVHYPNEVRANELLREIFTLYTKNGCTPSWTRAYLEQGLAEAGISDWMVKNTLSVYDNSFEDALISLPQEDTLPNGTDTDTIKKKIISIAAKHQLTANQVLQSLRNQELEHQLGVKLAMNTIRFMVLFADEMSETLDDVDERIVSIMTAQFVDQ